jgi:hypothetical protein
MGFIMKGIKAVVGLFILLVLIGAFFGHHDTSTPAATTSQHADTKTAYTRDNANFVSKERVDENIKLGLAKPGDYKEVQVPLSTVVVGGYPPESSTSKKEEQTTPSQSSVPAQTTTQSTKTPQSVIDAAIKSNLVKYSSIEEALVKGDDNQIVVVIEDSSQVGKKAALDAIASSLIDGYMSTDKVHTTFYDIYLKKRMIDGSLYVVGKSIVYGYDISEAVNRGSNIASKLTLGDKLIKGLSEN